MPDFNSEVGDAYVRMKHSMNKAGVTGFFRAAQDARERELAQCVRIYVERNTYGYTPSDHIPPPSCEVCHSTSNLREIGAVYVPPDTKLPRYKCVTH